jgi:hypothetical protein
VTEQETPKEKQSENYETIKLILEDIKKLSVELSMLQERVKRLEESEW